MGGFIVKQPNGKYCRFSTTVDCPTHINMTREDYIRYREKEAREEAENVLKNHLYPFEAIEEYFVPNNMTQKEFKKYIEKMKDPNGKYEIT